MSRSFVDPDVSAALTGVGRGIDALAALDTRGLDDGDVLGLIEQAEVLARRLSAVQVELLDVADRRRLGRDDGFFSAKTLVRHKGRLSPGRALARYKAMQAVRDLPDIGSALAAGEIGVEQVELLGKVHANLRVRDLMPARQATFIAQAQRLSHKDFELEVRRWERLVDQDGAEPANSRAHHNRDFTMVQDPIDRGWQLRGGSGALTGSAMKEVFDHYVDAELMADWQKARAEHGDAACGADLPRTEAQRRADALWQLFQDAAGADGSAVPPGFVHNVVWDADTFEEICGRLCGAEPGRLDPDSMRCETIDGTPLEPTEAGVNALFSAIRRVVIDADGVVIDLGRARFYTGSARHAVRLRSTHCIWPGCDTPTSRCQADHIIEHADGGTTSPANGINLCGGHNRLKTHGYTVHRDPAGTWHVTKPDGTTIQ